MVTKLTPQHIERLDEIVLLPVQFQEYICGTDVRVHVVGDKLFACAILHQGTDYRDLSAAKRPNLVGISSVPEDLQRRCIAVCRRRCCGVFIGAGIDLHVFQSLFSGLLGGGGTGAASSSGSGAGGAGGASGGKPH